MKPEHRIAIVGAGWAGLAAAITLARHGPPVTLIEAAPEAGGRARSLEHKGMLLDNGQHLFIGAYRETLALMQLIGIDVETAFRRLPLSLEMLDERGQRALRLHAPALPAPLHLLAALLGARGLSPGERLRALRFGASWQRFERSPEADIDVASWLREQGQTRRLCQRLWHPLCLAVMNTPPAEASARIFARVLRDAFLHRRHDADLLIPRRSLGELLPRPALAWLEDRGTALVHRRITAISCDDGKLRLQGRGFDACFDQAILAIGHHVAPGLLPQDSRLDSLRQRLSALAHSEPVCTVYLRYPEPVSLDHPMLGLLDGPGQWIFDRRVDGHPGVMAVVISANGPHMHLNKNALRKTVTRQLAALFPHWPAPDDGLVVREKRATFHAGVGIDALRPGNATPVPGLWLAGDFTDTGYPATLEGAVRSGVQCALSILDSPSAQAVA